MSEAASRAMSELWDQGRRCRRLRCGRCLSLWDQGRRCRRLRCGPRIRLCDWGRQPWPTCRRGFSTYRHSRRCYRCPRWSPIRHGRVLTRWRNRRCRPSLNPPRGRRRIKISDDVLRQRCLDLLNAQGDFDRPVNQALIVLEDRVRTMARLPATAVGKSLMRGAFGNDGPIILSDIRSEQEGWRSQFVGMYAMLRNPTSHASSRRTTVTTRWRWSSTSTSS